MACIGYISTYKLIPKISNYTLRKGICGKDLGKRGTEIADKLVPEALGIVPGSIFLICLILNLVWFATSNPTKLLDCTSALLSICFMLFLGFTDDVLDWPWRYKLLLPSIATLPLLCCYNGSTSIIIPIQLRSFLMNDEEHRITLLGKVLDYIVTIDENAHGAIVNLGTLYLLYMGCLAVFTTNAINIYAGINGLEVGQSYIISCFILLHNSIEILHGPAEKLQNHLFSIMIIICFVGCTLGLLRHNWYPARVFVGDTYCYFAGMTFAVVGILGHFSKTLLLLFIPQIINFGYSIPQLFHIIPCPRHRLPNYDSKTNTMFPSTFTIEKEGGNRIHNNCTLINLCLQIFGPMREETLCLVLLGLQVVSCSVGLYFRHNVSHLFFE